MPPMLLTNEERREEKVRAYRILRSLAAYIFMRPNEKGKVSVSDFQEHFLSNAFFPEPKSKNAMEFINNGSYILNNNEAEELVLHLMTIEEEKCYLDCYLEKPDKKNPIQNFDEKKKLLDTMLKYFMDVHELKDERIQRLYEEVKKKQVSMSKNFASLSDRYQVLLGDEVVENDILEAIELDFIGYDQENYVGIKDQCLKWAKTNPFIYFMVRDLQTQKIIGYINVMPLVQDFYDELKKDYMDDIDIPAEKILRYGIPGLYSLYFASIVIHTSCKDRVFILKLLVNSVINFFKEKAMEGIIIDKMFAKEVSGPGKHLCESFGMKQSAENESIYEVSFYPPTFSSQHSLFGDFYKFYDEFYKQNTVKD